MEDEKEVEQEEAEPSEESESEEEDEEDEDDDDDLPRLKPVFVRKSVRFVCTREFLIDLL